MSVTRTTSGLIGASVMIAVLGFASAAAAQAGPMVIAVPSQQLAEAGSRVIAAQILSQAFAAGLQRTEAAMALTPPQQRRWQAFASALTSSMNPPTGPGIDLSMEPLDRAQVRLERDRLTYESERRVTDKMVRLYKVLNSDQQAVLNAALDSLGQLSITAVGSASSGPYE